jgi:hypothetical protein
VIDLGNQLAIGVDLAGDHLPGGPIMNQHRGWATNRYVEAQGKDFAELRHGAVLAIPRRDVEDRRDQTPARGERRGTLQVAHGEQESTPADHSELAVGTVSETPGL